MFAHVPVSIGIQLVCWALGRKLGVSTTASLWLGCLAGAAVCIMREVTQREYQWIERFGGGLRANMPGYVGIEVWQWNAHSLLETGVAIAASVGLAAIVTRRTSA